MTKLDMVRVFYSSACTVLQRLIYQLFGSIQAGDLCRHVGRREPSESPVLYYQIYSCTDPGFHAWFCLPVSVLSEISVVAADSASVPVLSLSNPRLTRSQASF